MGSDGQGLALGHGLGHLTGFKLEWLLPWPTDFTSLGEAVGLQLVQGGIYQYGVR